MLEKFFCTVFCKIRSLSAKHIVGFISTIYNKKNQLIKFGVVHLNEIEVNGRLEQLIKEITDKELTIAEMEKESLLSSNVGLSPLDLLNLFFAIEREFNIKIDRKEIIEHRLDKISDIKEIILKKC